MKKKSLNHIVKLSLVSTLFCVTSTSYAIQCFDKLNAFTKQSSAKVIAGEKGKVLKKFSAELQDMAERLGRDIMDSDILVARDLDTNTSFYVVVSDKDLFFLTNTPEKLGVSANWGLISNQTIGFNPTGFTPRRVQLGEDKVAINQGNRWKILRKEMVDTANLSNWIQSSDEAVSASHKEWESELSSLIGRPLKSGVHSYEILTVNDVKAAQFLDSEDGVTTFAVIKGNLFYLRKDAIKDELTNGAKVGLVPTSGPGFGVINKDVVKLEQGLALVIGSDGFQILPQYELASLLDFKMIDLDSIEGLDRAVLSFMKENQDALPAKMQELGLTFSEVASSKVLNNLNSDDAGKLWLNNAGVYLVKDNQFTKIDMDAMGIYRGENLQIRIEEDKVLIFEKGKRVISKQFKAGDADYALEVQISDADALKTFAEFHGINSEEFKKSVMLYNGKTFDIEQEATLAEYNGTLYILDEGEFKKYTPNMGIGFHANVEREFNVGDNMIVAFTKMGMVKYPILKEGNEAQIANLYLSTQNTVFNSGLMNQVGLSVVSHLLNSKLVSSKDLFASTLHMAFTKSGASYFVLKSVDESFVISMTSTPGKVTVQKVSELSEELLLENYTKVTGGQKLGFLGGKKVKEDTLLPNEIGGVLALKANHVLGREISDQEFAVIQNAFQFHHMVYGGVVYQSQRTQETVNKVVAYLGSQKLFSAEDIKAMVSSGLL